MKKSLYFILPLVFIIVFYIGASFISLSFKPVDMDEELREVVGFVLPFWGAIGGLIAAMINE